MSTAGRITVATTAILLAGAAGLAAAGDRLAVLSAPDGPCDASCNAAVHRCLTGCRGAHGDPSCEAGCRFAWELCSWRCDLLPTSPG